MDRVFLQRLQVFEVPLFRKERLLIVFLLVTVKPALPEIYNVVPKPGALTRFPSSNLNLSLILMI